MKWDTKPLTGCPYRNRLMTDITYKGPRTQIWVSPGPFILTCFILLAFIYSLFLIDLITWLVLVVWGI